ncbi:MAG: DHH family phosphoesterase, partial [Coriobacteriales bacterium]|nr:DHH family phosphoesterase [Coriobacteriales bacterium]
MTTNYTVRDIDAVAIQDLQRTYNINHLMAATLAARGILTGDSASVFLNPSLERDWGDPAGLPGLTDVADALEAAIRAHKRILIFGDYDVDGLTATATLARALRALGNVPDTVIPRRDDGGYGITPPVLQRIYACDPNVVITVDNGVSAAAEVAKMQQRGIEVLITDHHEPGSEVPVGVPVADPKLDAECNDSMLAGVGVALKLVQALGARFDQPGLWRDYTDLATLGTVADSMLLAGENRALVADGIGHIIESKHAGIAALVALACKNRTGNLTSTDLSFTVIPRLNAAGRMDNADIALELLMTDDPVRAQDLAERIEDINKERRGTEAQLSEEVMRGAERYPASDKALVLAGEGWHDGVRGIVASRVVGQYHVPALVFTIDGDEARASGRSVGDVNLYDMVDKCADLFSRYGGHAGAVGITMPTANLDELRRRMV